MKPLQWLQDRQKWTYLVLVSAVSVLAIYLSIPFNAQFHYDYRLGQVWLEDDLIAPTDFVLPKSPDDIEADRERLFTDRDLYFEYQSVQEQWYKLLLSKLDSNTARASLQAWKEVGVVNFVPTPNHRLFLSDGTLLDLSQALTPEAIRVQLGLTDSIEILPCFILNEAKTDSAWQHKIDALALNKGWVRQGTPIILRGAVITPEKYELIKALQENYDGGEDAIQLKGRFGALLYIILVFFGIAAYLQVFDSSLLEHSSSLNLFMFSFTGAAVTTLLISYLTFLTPFVVPLLLLPVLLRSFFNDRLALFMHFMLLVLLGPFLNGNMHFLSVQFAAGFVTLFNIRGIYKRSQLFQSTLNIMLVLVLVHASIYLIRQEDWTWSAAIPMVSTLAGTLVLLFVFPLIYFFERTFGVVSDLTLLELSDTNSPLLKRLSKEAPGTFQHTMQVANLAEHATELVGGNTLLVRTGALYHDIGKLTAPMYFTENQTSSASPHDDMSYTESAEIIIGHVGAGIELAKREHLPDIVIDFIRTHHGTSRVEYFYRKFRDDHPDSVQFQQFHYPGPKPFSKETAIVMMSDAVEASTRSLPEKTQQSLSEMIDRVIDHQLSSGQFDNATITLKEINVIREAFKKFMRGVYHVRIQYPD